MKILLVDDDVDLRRVLAYGLQQRGYDVVTSPNGSAALDQWQAVAPDIVMLDVGWPTPVGLGILHRMRQRGAAPVLLLSVSSRASDLAEGLRSGADDVCVKPFLLEHLVERLHALASRRGLLQPPTDATQAQECGSH